MAESGFSDDYATRDPEEIVSDSDCDDVPEYLKCTDPDILKYREEIAAYEGFYVTDNENFRRKTIGGVVPCCPEDSKDAIVAAKLAIKHVNENEGESLEFEDLVRSNWQLVAGVLYYITFLASNGKFYETKVGLKRNAMCYFEFLREAKYHPNLGSL